MVNVIDSLKTNNIKITKTGPLELRLSFWKAQTKRYPEKEIHPLSRL